MQTCRRKAPDNNNSVEFTSSREDSSTSNDSMVMKIAHTQLHMYTNIMYKFQSSTCKTVAENCVHGQTDGQTDGRTAMAIPVYRPQLCCGGYNKKGYHCIKISRLVL